MLEEVSQHGESATKYFKNESEGYEKFGGCSNSYFHII